MGWIRCFGCEKLQRDFMAQTFALIAPVHAVLHRVSYSYETIPNSHRHYATHQHEFRVQWSGLGVLVEKNPDVTSWHVLLH